MSGHLNSRRGASRSRCNRFIVALAVALAAIVAPPTTRSVEAEPSGASPGSPRGAATVITTGDAHSCAIDEFGRAHCWGLGALGRLGTDDIQSVGDDRSRSISITDPIDLGAGRSARSIAAGGAHTCALLDNGDVKCWGEGTGGQLGTDDNANEGDQRGDMAALAAIDFGDVGAATAVAAGRSHACALVGNGQVRCWGRGGFGQLGTGSQDNVGDHPTFRPVSAAPMADLGAGRTATAIAAGSNHTCALSTMQASSAGASAPTATGKR